MKHDVVFLIEDEEVERVAQSLLLGGEDFIVHAFDTCAQLFGVVREGARGCVILNSARDATSALELMSELKARSLSLPLIVCAGDLNPNTGATATKAGAFRFISKPISTSELVEAVRSAFTHCRGPDLAIRIADNLGHRIGGELHRGRFAPRLLDYAM